MKLRAKGVKKPETKKAPASGELEKLQKTLQDKQDEILELEKDCVFLRREILSLQILPFKLGDEVIAEVPAGKTKKKCKCVLEDDSGVLYVRPYKNDGELSGRRFSITPVGDKTYGDYLEKA